MLGDVFRTIATMHVTLKVGVNGLASEARTFITWSRITISLTSRENEKSGERSSI